VLRIKSRMLSLPANQFPDADELDREAERLRADLRSARQNGDPAAIRAATARATRAGMRSQRARLIQGIRVGPVAFLSIQGVRERRGGHDLLSDLDERFVVLA